MNVLANFRDVSTSNGIFNYNPPASVQMLAKTTNICRKVANVTANTLLDISSVALHHAADIILSSRHISVAGPIMYRCINMYTHIHIKL